MTRTTMLTNRKEMNDLYDNGFITSEQYNAYVNHEWELLDSLGLLDDTTVIKCLETTKNGMNIQIIETTRYDALDWFIEKECVDYIHDDTNNRWGLFRSDDSHILWFMG